MGGSWEISTDARIGLISWKLSGFFELSDIDRFQDDTLAALDQLNFSKGKHIGYSDIRAMTIQSQEAVEKFGGVLSDTRIMPRRHAVVVPASLVRSQFMRVAPNAAVELFLEPVRAKSWLLSGG